MQFALVDNIRTAAKPGLAGLCPACKSPMIAKCGQQRVHHWAHRGLRSCDAWKEPETAWHRAWKNRFPTDWQEIIHRDEKGEKHIADVHTPLGLTIECQHSHLAPGERMAREQFYRAMAWVVDGARLKRDVGRFIEGARTFRAILKPGIYVTPFPEQTFPLNWLNSTVPVFFDFENAEGITDASYFVKRSLWCLLPGRISGQAVVLEVSHDTFVELARTSTQAIPSQAVILDNIARALEAQRQRQMQQLRATQMTMLQWRRRPQGHRRRYASF